MADLDIKEIVEWMIEEAKDKVSDSIAVIDEGEIVKSSEWSLDGFRAMVQKSITSVIGTQKFWTL